MGVLHGMLLKIRFLRSAMPSILIPVLRDRIHSCNELTDH